jgi:hypothetical protein
MSKGVKNLLMNETGEKLGIEDVTVIKVGDTANYIGTEWHKQSRNVLLIGQSEYAKHIDTDLSEKDASRKIQTHEFKRSPDTEFDMSLQRQHMETVGKLGWLAKTQLHIAYAFSEISRYNSKPSQRSLTLAKRLCEYGKRTHTQLRLVGNVRSPCLLGWCDGAYNIHTGDSRIGYLVQLVDSGDLARGYTNTPKHNYIAWKSIRPSRSIGSSSVAELKALREVVKQMPLYSSVVEEMWGVKPKELYFTDNQSVMDWVHSGWMKSDPQWQGELNNINSDLKERGGQVHWVPTADQRADELTKFISRE